ncbi:helix-turn-helix domain-containing protein [Deinococcus peraridilitoris]|nr:helix-turn-helix transcriptional regulator [Deinococcus peraridilitoris]
MNATPTFGELLRGWRQQRRLSQLDLAGESGVSARHVSFMETGRAVPSREMVLRLSEQLEVPLRERNVLLQAAGYAPLYPQRSLDDPAMQAVRAAIDAVLSGYGASPALAVDRHWTLVTANRAALRLLDGLDPSLLTPPLNVLRLSLHPNGLSPRILNLSEWRAHVLARLRRQIDTSGDATLRALHQELSGYFTPAANEVNVSPAEVFVPIRLASSFGPLTLLSITTVFGTPVDVTLSELAIEAFLPADAVTAVALQLLADDGALPASLGA